MPRATSFKSAALILISLAGITVGPLEAQPGTLRSKMTVVVAHNTGVYPLSGRLIIDSSNGRVYDGPIKDHAEFELPFGKYLLLFDDPNGKPVSREVLLNSPESLIVLAQRVENVVADVQTPKTGSLTLRVAPQQMCSEDALLWAKIVGVYSDYLEIRTFDADGAVTIDPIDVGEYVVLILESSAVRATQRISVGGMSQPTIPLGACPPPI